MAPGQGDDLGDHAPELVHVDRQHDAEESHADAAPSSTASANGAGRTVSADDNLSPRPPLAALALLRPLSLLHIREQPVDGARGGARGSSSATAAAGVRKGNGVLIPSSPSSSSSSDRSSGCSLGADVDSSVREFLATRDTGGRWQEMEVQLVENKTTPIVEATSHYYLNPVNEAETQSTCSNITNLVEAYSKFRPVRGDGECFYRSFIFSYLEQVLYRQDMSEERRILAVVEEIAEQYAHLGWPYEFSIGRNAFAKLINKVMKWKRGRNVEASNSSYYHQKLLKFFNSDKKMQQVFVFLRLVAATRICSHGKEYELLITELGEGYNLEDWCFHNIIQCHQWADHIQMNALTTALDVSLRVVNLKEGPVQDIHINQGVPRVDLLFTGNHYDIIYPRQFSDKSLPQSDAAIDFESHSDTEVETPSLPSAARDIQCQSLPAIADTLRPLIRSVWLENCEEELGALLSVVRQGRVMIAIDMEFASTAGKQKCPKTTAEWYDNIHGLVNGGDILQFGIAVSFDTSSNPQAAHVCEINLMFDVKRRSYNEGTIKFLKAAEHDLDAHNTHGVLPARLANWILHEFDRLYDQEITWVVFQGDADVGFLLKLLGNMMPDTRLEYLQRHNCSLPQLYDVRVLARILTGGHVKGLSSVATSLKVNRIGKEHSSGSDALLTLDCFLELRRLLPGDKMHQYRGITHGILAVDRIVNEALPMGHQSLQVIDVWDHNFEEEVIQIVEAVQNNYSIVGVDGHFFPALYPRPYHTDQQMCLDLITEVLRAVRRYEISLAFVSYTGQISQGRWWRFNVAEYSYPQFSMNGTHRYIHFARFAGMLKSRNLLYNSKITWATFNGAEVFASLFHMVQRGTQADIPMEVLHYRRLRSSMFPFLRDIGFLVSWQKDTPLVDIAQQLGLSIPHEQSGWNAIIIAQMMVRLRNMLDDSETFLKAFADCKGLLLSKCCSRLHC